MVCAICCCGGGIIELIDFAGDEFLAWIVDALQLDALLQRFDNLVVGFGQPFRFLRILFIGVSHVDVLQLVGQRQLLFDIGLIAFIGQQLVLNFRLECRRVGEDFFLLGLRLLQDFAV